jgi:hypothetical protein
VSCFTDKTASDAVGLIQLDVTVHDEKGSLLSGLAASDSQVAELVRDANYGVLRRDRGDL